jgi:hypothetical protein
MIRAPITASYPNEARSGWRERVHLVQAALSPLGVKCCKLSYLREKYNEFSPLFIKSNEIL